MTPTPRRILSTLALTLLATHASAQELEVEVAKLVAGDAATNDNAGFSVSASGDVIVVGVPFDDVGASLQQGSAWIHRWDGSAWVPQQQLLAVDGEAGDDFGEAVAVSGDVVAIGAHLDDVHQGFNEGSVYVYRRQGSLWSLEQHVFAVDGTFADLFGDAVAVDGDVLVVGAPYDEPPGGEQDGSAYVFRWNGTAWAAEQKLVASDGSPQSSFGNSVAVSGDAIAVGAFTEEGPSHDGTGSVYVFRWDGAAWSEEATLVASDGLLLDFFGYSVAISGDVVVAGAEGHDIGTFIDQGAAYVFRRHGASWIEEQKLLASDGNSFDDFGQSVSVSGGLVVVGASGADGQGSAYSFRWNGEEWLEEARLVLSDAASGDQAGWSAALSGDLAVVGAYGDDHAPGTGQGSACAFDLLGDAWTWLGRALAGSNGFPVLSAFGELSPGSPTTLALHEARPGSAVALIIGLSELSAPFKGGVLVPSPNLVLTGFVTNGLGQLTLTASWPAAIPPGSQLWIQEWIADPEAVAGLAASNAVLGTTP